MVVKIIRTGEKHDWHRFDHLVGGRFVCSVCDSVIEIETDDVSQVMDWALVPGEGVGIWIACPICKENRFMMADLYGHAAPHQYVSPQTAILRNRRS